VDTTTHKIPCKCTLFKHGPEKQEGRGSGGVAILLSPQGTKAWEKAGSPDPISVSTSEEIGWAMGLELHYEDSKENILKYFIVTAYHPDSTKGTEIHKEFLEVLADLYDKAPRDATVISGEDINAQLGKRVAFETEEATTLQNYNYITGPFSTHESSNPRGNELCKLLDAAEMTSASTWFENTSHDTFFDHRNKQRLQLDHFMISQKSQKQVTNCKRTRPIISSDHLPVKIKLRAVKKILPKQNLSEIELKTRWRVNQRKRKRNRKKH
jgi:exonuclease III